MLYREIIAVCSQIHTKHTNTPFRQNGEYFNDKRRGRNIMSEILYMFQQHTDRPAHFTSLHFTMNRKIQQFTPKPKTVRLSTQSDFYSLSSLSTMKQAQITVTHS